MYDTLMSYIHCYTDLIKDTRRSGIMNIGICGLNCNTCGDYTSGVCLGCRKSGVDCHSECSIKKCAIDKNVEVCKFCDDFNECTTITDFLVRNPHAKDNLDKHYHRRKDGARFVNLYPNNEHTFSSVAVVGNTLYTSHIGGMIDKDGKLLETVEEQTHQTLKNLRKHLEEFGVDLNSVVKTTVYLKSMKDFREMRDAYGDYFTDGYPVRMTATTEFFDEGRMVMMDAIAYLNK